VSIVASGGQSVMHLKINWIGIVRGAGLSKFLNSRVINMSYLLAPIYKPIGYTPLQALNKWRLQHKDWDGLKMTYTGRLDPMAEGVMLIAIDEALQDQSKYQKLGKTYQAEILFGFTTDSYDALGLPKEVIKQPILEGVKKEVASLVGDFKFSLPPFSSYKIKGKRLFWWALQNRLAEIVIPQKTVLLNRLDFLSTKNYTADQLINLLIDKFSRLQTDLRQETILQQWHKLLLENSNQFLSVNLEIDCSSGTYIRSLAKELGRRLASGAILLSLVRTRVGEYSIKDCEEIEADNAKL